MQEQSIDLTKYKNKVMSLRNLEGLRNLFSTNFIIINKNKNALKKHV